MFQRDYIMRMAEQCAQALARLMLKKRESPEQARTAVDEAGRSILGLEPHALALLPADEILQLLSFDGRPDVARSSMAVRLLFEAGELSQSAQDGREALRFRRRAADLLIALLANEGGLDRHADAAVDGHREAFAELVRDIEMRQTHDAVDLIALCRYYELTGELGRAEDQVYRLTRSGAVEHVGFGVAFYERLLDRSDAELEAGNLPRDEVEEALARLQALDR